MSKTLCFTGKRPKDLYGYNDTYEYGRLLRDVEAKLYEFYTKFNVRTFISGGAQGFDQVAFWAVERMKRDYGLNDVINIVHIPFNGQESRWKQTGLFSQAEFKMMLDAADDIKIVTPNLDTSDFGKVARALNVRNESMVNDSDYVFGLFNCMKEDFHTAKGGTANCLRYATQHNKDTYIMAIDSHVLYHVAHDGSIEQAGI